MEQTAEKVAGARPRYLYVQTMGCQMNEYDSLRVQQMLAARGYGITTDIDAADVVFLNTCSVREKAEQKVYSFLGRLRRMKARNPGLKIIVAGCVAQQLGKGLLERFSHLDLVLGTRAVGSLPQLLDYAIESEARTAYLPEEEGPREDSAPEAFAAVAGGVSAPVTIMQGCNNFCSYCIVPYVRGRERSRPSGEIIREIRRLTAAGAGEVVLLGQNVNSYGRGLEEKISFVDLLRRIEGETDVIRLRFTTSHPKDLTEELIECFAGMPILCEHLHLPFQAGSDSVLKRMRRGYTASHYVKLVEDLRGSCPDIGLTSDVMVGFPGESEEDFECTLRLMEEVQFDNVFSFRYSDRPFAESAGYGDKVPEEVKARRLSELQALQSEITLRKNRAEEGGMREVLTEGPSKSADGQLTGRTRQNRIVNFEGPMHLVGSLVTVRIVAGFSHSLRGDIVFQP